MCNLSLKLGLLLKKLNARRSFTLLETLISIALLALVMIPVSTSFLATQHSWIKQYKDIIMLQQSQWALELLSNELRHSTIGAVSIGTIEGDDRRLRFRVDNSGDGVINAGDRLIEYKRKGNWWPYTAWPFDLRRKEGVLMWDIAANFLVDGVDNFQIDATNTVVVNLVFRYRPDLAADKYNPNFSVRTRIRPRN